MAFELAAIRDDPLGLTLFAKIKWRQIREAAQAWKGGVVVSHVLTRQHKQDAETKQEGRWASLPAAVFVVVDILLFSLLRSSVGHDE